MKGRWSVNNKHWRLSIFRRLPRSLRRWYLDRRGAATAQFVIVVPAFAIISIGLWSVYSVYAAQQSLCEGTREAARYLQVEAPQMKEDEFPYPSAWEAEAVKIVNSYIKSSPMLPITPLDVTQIKVTSGTNTQSQVKPMSPKEMSEVRDVNVSQYWFFVAASASISNPISYLFTDNSGGNLNLTCRRTAYFEGPPIGPTLLASGPKKKCPPVQPCPPNATAEPTVTPCPAGQSCPKDETCPVCRRR